MDVYVGLHEQELKKQKQNLCPENTRMLETSVSQSASRRLGQPLRHTQNVNDKAREKEAVFLAVGENKYNEKG